MNSNIVKLVEVLNSLCVDGFNTIDKSDIFDAISTQFDVEWDDAFLDKEIKDLADNGFIVLKYCDEDAVCFAFTEAGSELISRIKTAKQNEQQQAQKSRRQRRAQQADEGENNGAEDASSSKVLAELLPDLPPENKACKAGNLKSTLLGLLGGLFGGAISGAIITLLALLL